MRKIIYTTNAIESLNRQLRKIIKTRGHFPSDEAATKLIYLALRNITAKCGRLRRRLGRRQPICHPVRGRDLTNEAYALRNGGLRAPHNPAARGELLGATAPWQIGAERRKINRP